MEFLTKVEPLKCKELVTKKGNKYLICEIEPEYILAIDLNNGNKLITGWCGTLNEDEENLMFFESYEKKNVENRTSINNEIKTVPPTEFITAWNEMEKYWVNNDGDDDENSYYNRIINQKINIELPLLGIKTELFWCPPTVECLDDMFKSMVEETYFDLLITKEQCCYTGGGIWIAEVPFEYGDKQLVMVVDNEDTNIWTVYQNVLKDNGKYDSVEHSELMIESNDANHIVPDWQIYYVKALQLLAERKE